MASDIIGLLGRNPETDESSARFVDRGGEVWNLSAPQFGAVYNAQGEITNGHAVLSAAIEAVPLGATIVWNRPIHISTPLEINKRVNLLAPLNAPIILNTPGATGIRVNTSQYGWLAYINWSFALLGDRDSCINGIEFIRVNDSEISLDVRCGATQWGAITSGCIGTDFRFRMSPNHPHWFASEYQKRCLLIRTAPIAAEGVTGCNNARYRVQFAGGYRGGYEGVRIEHQDLQGNIHISGVIEGIHGSNVHDDPTYPAHPNNGRPLTAEGCIGLELHNLHFEVNGAKTLIQHCIQTTIGGGTIILGTGDGGLVHFDGCNDTAINELLCNRLLVERNCERTRLGTIRYNADGTGSLLNESKSTVFTQSAANTASATRGVTGKGGGQGNLLPQGKLNVATSEYAGYNALPHTVERTGAGRTDTTSWVHPDALRIQSTDSAIRMIGVPIPGSERMAGEDVTVWAYVRWISGGSIWVGLRDADSMVLHPIAELRPWTGGGADPRGFVLVAARVRLSAVIASQIIVGGYAEPYNCYIGEIGACHGPTAPQGATL